MKPPIRWAGSKRFLLTVLRRFWTGEPSRYIEPFAGSACLFFDLRPQHALLADLNPDLIGAYRALQRDPWLVLECLKRLKPGKSAYYAVRAMRPQSLSEAEGAARFLYLNRYCFNGLYRTSKAGHFNVPYGPPKTARPDYEREVLSAAAVLRGAELLHADFETSLRQVMPGDFVYLDPPYVIRRRRVFAEYFPGSFTSDDLSRVGTSLRRLDDIGARFLVSYGDSREARELLKPWFVRRVRTRRNIAGFAGARRSAYELLASNVPMEVPCQPT